MPHLLYVDAVISRSLRKGFAFSALLLVGLLVAAAPSRLSAQIVINEMAASNNGSVENAGDFPDWIELYNNSFATVNMGNWSLFQTNPGSSDTFTFRPNTFLDPHQYLIVWCDSATNSPGIHTLFKIPQNDGGTLSLRDNGGLTIDAITFGLQLSDFTIGRVPDGGGNIQLTIPTPALPNQSQSVGTQLALKFNEWMATNSAGPNEDWLELFNADPLPVPLGGLVFSGKLPNPGSDPAIPPLSFIQGNGFFKFKCDGSAKKGADHLDFKLSSSNGETLSIYLPDRVTFIERISFALGQAQNQSEGRLPDGGTNFVRFPVGRDTPGDSNFLPLTNAIINEVLTHTDPPFEDAIELYNPTTSPVDISYWWLSNKRNDPFKFRIPAGTIIPAGGYKVFYEQIGSTGGFNTSGTGTSPDFTMNSANGDELYLFTGDSAGRLTGFRRGIDFPAAENGVSFGRYILSTGEADITPMSARTFGSDNPSSISEFRTGTGRTNVYPKVGPIVISEIMYKPPNIQVTNDNSIDEFVELQNIASTNVPLYWVDSTNKNGNPVTFTNGWKLSDAVSYKFPGTPVLKPRDFLLVVNFDPGTNLTQLADFKSKFNIPSSFTNFYGPYGGKLKNSGATVKLERPDIVQGPLHPDYGLVPFLLVDKVNYGDSAPWPLLADGGGASLQRRRGADYGNDPINWGAMAPSPGGSNIFSGTVSFGTVTRIGGRVDLQFTAQAGQPYTIQYQNDLQVGAPWTTLTNMSSSISGPLHFQDTLFSPTLSRFYRVYTPQVP